jgi:predicted membrane protein (TIGR00267 family)
MLEKLPEIDSISRRYFISNGFDGALTATGVTVGSYLSGVEAGTTVFKVAAGAAVGLATSGVWSVWEIEKAEKLAQIRQLEEEMLEDLGDSELQERKMEKRKLNAVMSGLGPVLGVMLPASVFLATPAITLLQATAASVAIGAGLLFGFGVYMARISGQSWLKAGLRMGAAGLVAAAINVALPG